AGPVEPEPGQEVSGRSDTQAVRDRTWAAAHIRILRNVVASTAENHQYGMANVGVAAAERPLSPLRSLVNDRGNAEPNHGIIADPSIQNHAARRALCSNLSTFFGSF